MNVLGRTLVALICLLAAAPATAANQRIALVVGNNTYTESPLQNSVNDANAVSGALERLGFEVIKRTDATRSDMERAIVEFGQRIQDHATALVFYAGHGVQANGHNYLVPVDATLKSERALRFEAVDVADILEELELSPSKVNLVVLDACRNNPFERKFRGGGRGLAPIDAAAGTLIAYATAPGSTAADGSGENGIYTEAFLSALGQPGLKVEEVFKQVRIRVADRSNGAQIPWESSSLTGDFVFNQGRGIRFEVSGSASTADTVVVPLAAEPPARSCTDLSGVWLSVQDNSDCEPLIRITRGEDGGYTSVSDNCYATQGSVYLLDGKRMHIAWAGVPCKGMTEFELDDTCSAGTGGGEVQGPVPLVCRGTFGATIQRVGD